MITEPPNLRRKHSKIGLASFIIGLGTSLFIVGLFIFSIPLDTFLNGYQRQNLNLGLGLLVIFAPPLIHFIGLILGIVGVCQPATKKLFSILGIILNGLFFLLGLVVLVIIMITISAAVGGFH